MNFLSKWMRKWQDAAQGNRTFLTQKIYRDFQASQLYLRASQEKSICDLRASQEKSACDLLQSTVRTGIISLCEFR